ncbi:IQ domain-containing protein F5-like [Ochotona princeps]|uniref:IQ domain-containing protein F5-like n=1 Tax=Ochotona princeps TaxID=9978 RepID=UPI0027145304|nr:IQ domain-containing protein F5-like [Ochotona princeps]
MGIRFCKDGQFCEIVIEDVEETTEWRRKSKQKKEKPPPPPPPPPPPQPKPPPKPKPPSNKDAAARKIQAWWRGTLLRRTLLHMALQVWVIQCWWRRTLMILLQRRRRAALEVYARETWAAGRLQSWFRMWHIRRQYCRLLNAVRIIQISWRWHNCHTRGVFQGTYEITESQLRLELDIFLGSHICRITDCIPFPIKN